MDNIEIIMIPVTDQQKAKEFYLRLGFHVLLEAPGAHGDTWLQMGFPDEKTSIALSTFHGVICQTSDIKKDIAELAKKGIQVGKIDDTPWGQFAWVKDPDGNSNCLHQR